MKLKSLPPLALCVAALFASLPSHATFVQSTDATTAGFTTTTTYGFTEAGLANGTVVTNQYAGVNFSPNLYQGSQDCTGFPNMTTPCLGNYFPVVVPWTVIFSSVQTQAGFNMVTNPNTTLFEAFLGATLVDSSSVSTDFTSGSNFYGFEAVSFDSIKVTTSGDGLMLLDNLTFNSNAIPEPGSLALVGLGLAGLVSLRRRTR